MLSTNVPGTRTSGPHRRKPKKKAGETPAVPEERSANWGRNLRVGNVKMLRCNVKRFGSRAIGWLR
jgi:hypothetical protein